MNLQSIDMKHAKDIAKIGFAHGVARMPSPDGQAAAGKALRDKIPRKQQGEWSPASGRPNPIDFLHKLDAGRMKKLVPIRYGRMLQSPFAFFRGAAGVMASDLARMPTTRLKVQACGDCHLVNFGGFATPERNSSTRTGPALSTLGRYPVFYRAIDFSLSISLAKPVSSNSSSP